MEKEGNLPAMDKQTFQTRRESINKRSPPHDGRCGVDPKVRAAKQAPAVKQISAALNISEEDAMAALLATEEESDEKNRKGTGDKLII